MSNVDGMVRVVQISVNFRYLLLISSLKSQYLKPLLVVIRPKNSNKTIAKIICIPRVIKQNKMSQKQGTEMNSLQKGTVRPLTSR